MPRRNANARPKPKRRSVHALARLVKQDTSPTAREANDRFYDIGSALLPGAKWDKARGVISRVFPSGPDTASSARKTTIE